MTSWILYCRRGAVGALRHFFDGIGAADGLDLILFGFLVVVLVIVFVAVRRAIFGVAAVVAVFGVGVAAVSPASTGSPSDASVVGRRLHFVLREHRFPVFGNRLGDLVEAQP